MPIEDFVGRWIGGNDRRRPATIEIERVDGRLVVRAIGDADGELAEIRDLSLGEDEVRFAAHWLSGRSTLYRLRRSGGELVVHATFSRSDSFTQDLNSDGTQRWRSGVLHIAPGHSAGGSLGEAIRISGRTDSVISYHDDLSCGPIDSDETSVRRRWWDSIHEGYGNGLDRFWQRILSTSDRLVVWFGRHSAQEHAFFLAFVERLGERPYDIIDVTGLQMPIKRPDGTSRPSRPAQSVSMINQDELATLLGTERALTAEERDAAAQRWRRLKAENAPFRIVTDAGLVSAPADVFDALLLRQASKEWRRAARVIGETMGHNGEPYRQVGDVMLSTRVEALVEQGKLLAHGDPWLMRSDIRLPD